VNSAQSAGQGVAQPSAGLPSGLVTFLFTDIEGSTRLNQRLGPGFATLIADHDRLLTDAVVRHGGAVVRTLGDGVFAAFPDAVAGLRAAMDGQRALLEHSWPDTVDLRVRMGLHTDVAEAHGRDYTSLGVHAAARVAEAAHGGQVLVSSATAAAVGTRDTPGDLLPLGMFRLRGLDDPIELLQLTAVDVPAEFPAIRALPAAAHNVPALRTTFIGRDAELRDLTELVRRRGLVTIVGPGGAGKTRLAFEMAKTIAADFSDGAWVVMLADAMSDNVLDRLMHSLGIPEQPSRTRQESLVDALRQRHMLVVLDNCEHVAAGVTEVLEQLGQCPTLSVVATSREPLLIAGETTWWLPPLGLPGSDTAPEPTESDAVQLFVDRARLVDPAFTLGETTTPLVRRICRELDGLPLAIELAVARLRHFGLDELAARIPDRLALLGSDQRTGQPRHRTIRALIDWSYDPLGEPERLLFRRASVFRGPFTLEAAERVCADDALPADDVFDMVARLIDRSLLLLDDTQESTRYRMLVTIGDYASEKLEESGEADDVCRRHLSWVADRASSLAAELDGPDAHQALAGIDAIYNNLIAALRYAASAGLHDLALDVGVQIAEYWRARGRMTEGRELLLSLSEPAVDPLLIARALSLAGHLCNYQGDHQTALRLCSDALERARRLGDPEFAAHAAARVAWTLSQLGDLDGAEQRFIEATNASQPRAASLAWNGLGSVAFFRGKYADAVTHYERGLALADQAGFAIGVITAKINLAEAFVELGEPLRAESLLQEISGQIVDLHYSSLPVYYETLARACALDGRDEEARGHLTEAITIARELGDEPTAARLQQQVS
jgi:predicted ATPase/class 3 adenylate cyclase